MNAIQEQLPFGFVYSSDSSLLNVIIAYFSERQFPADEAELFYYYYASMDWHDDTGIKISNWIPLAKDWINNLQN